MNQSSTILPKFSVSEVFIWRDGEETYYLLTRLGFISLMSKYQVMMESACPREGCAVEATDCTLSHPIAGCGQGVIEAAERGYSVQLSDGNQLLAVCLLKGQCALRVLLKQAL